jgi:hypothetical protein
MRSAAMYTKDMETEIITRTEAATKLIRELTTAFALSEDHSVEALKSYNALMEEHIATLTDVQQIIDKIISDMEAPPST